MAVRGLDEIVIDCRDPATLVQFWAAIFDVEPVVRDPAWAYIEGPRLVRIAFQRVPESKSVKNRVHLDVDVDDIAHEADRLIALGAQRVGGIHHDDELGKFQILLDPEGNEFCLVSE